ncbi:MAG TPA: glycosyltransferase [Hanamia sp.]|nr:glycosyltransferase [Hanamia sp.]
MESNSKKISVVLPVYNGLPFLESSVHSVLLQSFPDFELLIVDDRSDDGSLEYLQSLNDPRIRLFINEANKGLFYNLNFLIRRAGSPLIKLWAQDDVMDLNCLHEILCFHERYPQVGFSYSAREIINLKGAVITGAKPDATPELISTSLHSRIAFFTGSIAGNIANVTLTRKALETVGLFDESMKISGDFDMWVRIAEKYPVGFINKPIVQLRDHPGQLSRQEKYYPDHLKEDLKVYAYLFKYASPAEKKEGRRLLRNHKLLFYYTLMIKAFLKGSFKTGISFYRTLSRFDNIYLMTFYFVKNRILLRENYLKIHIDNSAFFERVPLANTDS